MSIVFVEMVKIFLNRINLFWEKHRKSRPLLCKKSEYEMRVYEMVYDQENIKANSAQK